MNEIDLNKENIPVADHLEVMPLRNKSEIMLNPYFDSITVLFDDMERILIELIFDYAKKKGAIFGCVAWFTSKPILQALSLCENVQIIVQKEDFLRPDIGIKNVNVWKKQLHDLYNNINCKMERHLFKEPVCSLSVCGDPTVAGIRCVGNHNAEKLIAFPRSHHKFLVFCRMDNGEYFPEKVWTGSFNFTKNATKSLENVLILTDSSGKNKIINAYLNEHHYLYCLSEPLNWTNEWVTPEHRIGT